MDGRRGHAEHAAPPRDHERLTRAGNGNRGRWLPDTGPFAGARERPQYHLPRWPQAVPRFVGYRRTDRRRRSERRTRTRTRPGWELTRHSARDLTRHSARDLTLQGAGELTRQGAGNLRGRVL